MLKKTEAKISHPRVHTQISVHILQLFITYLSLQRTYIQQTKRAAFRRYVAGNKTN